MPLPSKRMTAQPAKPIRHRAGKPAQETRESSSEDESEEEREEEQQVKAPPSRPAATSFAPKTSSLASNIKNVDLNARKSQPAAGTINEDDFETEEEEGGSGSEDSGSGSGSEEESSEEEESSSEDEKPVRLRPTFIKKNQRDAANDITNKKPEADSWEQEEARKKQKADALIQEELEKQAQARAAGKKYWDDEDNIVDDVDDTDDLDPEAEYAAWKLREIKRLKRDRDALEAAEKEKAERERRDNLTQEEREAEDRAFIEAQKEANEGKGQMSFRQKYFHKGAFFMDDMGDLAKRDIMGGRYEDDVGMKEALPEYMQIRDMTKLGKKGRTRYKDMRSEDTGRWGDHLDRKGPPRRDGDFEYRGGDDRFRPDFDGDRSGPSGANASTLGERKRPPPPDDRGEDKRTRIS